MGLQGRHLLDQRRMMRLRRTDEHPVPGLLSVSRREAQTPVDVGGIRAEHTFANEGRIALERFEHPRERITDGGRHGDEGRR